MYLFLFIYVCIHINMYLFIYVYLFIFIYINMYIHSYIYLLYIIYINVDCNTVILWCLIVSIPPNANERCYNDNKPVWAVTSWTASAVEGALGVVAGHRGVGGAGFVGEVTLVHVRHTGRVPGRSVPATLTNALIPGLFIEGEKSQCEHYHSKIIRQQNTTRWNHRGLSI